MVFKSSMDDDTTRTTHYVNIILLVATGMLYNMYLVNHNGAIMGTILFILIIYTLAYFAVAAKYEIDNGSLKIRNALFPATIKKKDIATARIIPYESLSLTGVFRMAGPFGSAGMYFSKELGNLILFSRKQNGNTVYIRTNQGKGYILVPDDPEGFLREINSD